MTPVSGLASDKAAAKAMMDELGHGDFEHELISIDDQWRRDATDAVAEELRSAGFQGEENDNTWFFILEQLDTVPLFNN